VKEMSDSESTPRTPTIITEHVDTPSVIPTTKAKQTNGTLKTVDFSRGKTMKDFKITRKLGGGAEGAVFLATRLEDNATVAIKCMVCHTEKDVTSTREELGFLMALRHKNIIDHMLFFEEVKTTFLGSETRFYLVMEYSENGSLEDYIIATKKLDLSFTTEQILNWTSQICECMVYMHSNKFIHRDIKSENLLLSNNYETMKVCDFGFTKKTERVLTGTVLGTIVYMAPEIFANKRYDESIDIWSLGVVLLQLILMKNQKEVPDVRIEIGQDPNYIYQFLSAYDAKLTSIVEACLRLDPIDRPTAAEILQYINGNSTGKVFTHGRKKKAVSSATDTSDLSSPGSEEVSFREALESDFPDWSNNQRVSPRELRHRGSDDQIPTTGPLSEITTVKGRKFWSDNGWKDLYKVDWMDFRDAYQKLMGYVFIPKESERGMKGILCNTDPNTLHDVVTCTSFDKVVISFGFPFNEKALTLAYLRQYVPDDEDGEFTDEELEQIYLRDLDESELAAAKDEYLKMIIDYDKIFIDPISQEPLSVDSHCAPLRLVTDEEWSELMENEYDMDYEDDKMTRLERLAAWRAQSRAQQHENAINFLVSLERGHRYIILGAAAAGKTCMMRLLMYKAAIKCRNEGYMVPIFIPIANLAAFNMKDTCSFYLKCIRASADSMMNQSLRYSQKIEHFLMHMLRNNRALMLFDGLDEAANEDTKRAIEHAIVQIVNPPQVKLDVDGIHKAVNGVIITSRVSGFDSDEEGRSLFDDFTLARIQPLTYPIQQQIALKRDVTNEGFHAALRGKYRELAQTPLLLSLLIQQFKEKNKLPEMRSELYGEAIDTMINIFFRKTEPDKKLPDIEREKEEIKYLLSALACKLHAERKRDFVESDITLGETPPIVSTPRALVRNDSGKVGHDDVLNGNVEGYDHRSLTAFDEEDGREIPRERLIATWERLKKWLDQGKFSLLIVLNGKYRFSHLSFQEYFVARSWASTKHPSDIRVYETTIFRGKQLAFNDKRLRSLIIDPWYRETFLLCAGAMEQQDFAKFATFLQKLYRKQGGLIDSTVYNMINERPAYEKELYKDIEKTLNSERKLKVILDGVIHESVDLREMALARIRLYKNYNKIAKDLIKHLNDKENYAAEALSLIIPKGHAPTVDKLLEKANEKDARVKIHVSYCLGNIAEHEDEGTIQCLVNMCNDSDPKVVEKAIEALCKVAENTGNQLVINKLIEKLDVMSARANAASALGCIAKENDRRVMDKLIENAKIFESAAVALGQIAPKGDHEVLNLLIDCLEENGHDENNIVHAISKVADKDDSRQVTDKLIEMLKHQKRRIAYRAATALGSVVRTGDKRVIEKLIDMLREKGVVDKAIVALGNVSQKENELVTSKLLEMLGDKQGPWLVREQAAVSLSKVSKKGNQVVIKKLCERLGDVEEVVNASAAALEKISQKDNAEVIKAFLDLMLHPDTGVVERSVQILGRICTRGQNPEAKQALLKMLQSASQTQTLRGMCADALAQVTEFDDPVVVNVLNGIVLMSGDDRHSSHLRCCCLRALGVLISHRRNVDIAAGLFEMLHTREQDKEVEAECIKLLARICDVGKFIEFLKMKQYKDARATIFSIVVKAIRLLRDQNPNWKLEQSQIEVLEKNKCLESTFILLENAG
jgi:serine/threonine protein kinase/HEAT repeat protein